MRMMASLHEKTHIIFEMLCKYITHWPSTKFLFLLRECPNLGGNVHFSKITFLSFFLFFFSNWMLRCRRIGTIFWIMSFYNYYYYLFSPNAFEQNRARSPNSHFRSTGFNLQEEFKHLLLFFFFSFNIIYFYFHAFSKKLYAECETKFCHLSSFFFFNQRQITCNKITGNKIQF